MFKIQPKIIFLGTPEFARPFLQALVDSDYKPVLVITQPDEPAGRKQQLQPPPVKLLALEHGLAVAQPKIQDELYEILTQSQPDICLLVAYGKMISPKVLSIPKFGFINVHPSLLPMYRGPSPVQTAILNGETETGVSVMQLDRKMDHGPVFIQKKIVILPIDTNQTLHQRLAAVGADLLLSTLPQIINQSLKPQAQIESQATLTKIIKRDDGLVNWQKTALEISRQFRAFCPWPGVYTQWQGKRLKIANLSVLEADFKANLASGTVFIDAGGQLAVACQTGAIKLERLQLEGKNEVSASDFLRGYSNIVNQVLG